MQPTDTWTLWATIGLTTPPRLPPNRPRQPHYTTKNNIMPHMDSSYIEKNTPATIKIKGIRMVNDTTARVAYHKDTPITHQNDSITLVKRNGKWQANVVIKVPKIIGTMLGDMNQDSTKVQSPKKSSISDRLKKAKEQAEAQKKKK